MHPNRPYVSESGHCWDQASNGGRVKLKTCADDDTHNFAQAQVDTSELKPGSHWLPRASRVEAESGSGQENSTSPWGFADFKLVILKMWDKREE